MPDDNTDNPYAPPELVDEMPIVVKAEPSMFYKVTHAFFLVWAVPMCLYYALSPFWYDILYGWEHAMALVIIHVISLVFVIAYIGMVFDKIWAFGLCTIYLILLVVQPFFMAYSSSQEEDGFDGFPLAIAFGWTLYAVSISVSSLILFILSLTQHHKLRVSKALRLNTNP